MHYIVLMQNTVKFENYLIETIFDRGYKLAKIYNTWSCDKTKQVTEEIWQF